MRNIFIFSLVLVASLGAAQQEFTEFVGAIKVANAPTALAADSSGRLYYGTFNHNEGDALYAHISVIEDPIAAIGQPDEAGTTVVLMTGSGKINASGRGVQSMVFASDNTLFVGGDNSSSLFNNVWKFDYTEGTPPVFTEDTTFTANVRADRPRRRSGVSIVSEEGDGLIITCGFGTTSFIDYFDFEGHVVGEPLTDDLYYRDIHYLPPHNVAYPVRNGRSSPEIINSYVSAIDAATGGGTLVDAPLVPDGGTVNTTGHSIQGGYYYEAQDQLILCDALTGEGPAPTVRVFDVENNGTSVSLAYSISGTDAETPFSRVNDVVVVDNHLFVCAYDSGSTSYETSNIYVFRDPNPAAVKQWDLY